MDLHSASLQNVADYLRSGEIADVLAADNARFDRERFTEACEVAR